MFVKRFYSKLRETIWFIPSFYTVLASLLALVTVLVDTRYNDYVKEFIPAYFLTTVDLAQTILGTLSGALLTMTTISFSTIMVVLTMYSSQFSPRALQNFLHKSSTQRVLGIFMGGFVYSLLSLLFMRKASISHEVVSAFVGVVLAMVCLGFFAYFIHNVGNSIQVSRLIRELTDDVLRILHQEKKELEGREVVWMAEKPQIEQCYSYVDEVKSPSFGYVQYINYEELAEWALKHEAVIDIAIPIGEFVGSQSLLCTIYFYGEQVEADLSSYFPLGEERSILQDTEYGIEKIVEIALRALSPGINDPNTAIRCIHAISEILQRASQLPGGIAIMNTSMNQPYLLAPHPTVFEYFYVAFSQISFYGKEDISILNAMLDALIYIGQSGSQETEVKKVIYEICDYIWNRFVHEELGDLDCKMIENKRQTIRLLTSVT